MLLKQRYPSRPQLTGVNRPETMGAVCAVVYILTIIVFIPWPFYKELVAATSGGGNRDVILEVRQVETGRFLQRFPHSKLASYLSAILSLQSVVILGIGDDLFDIRWRHKVLIPAFAVIPMLIVYFVDFGVTQIIVPTPLRKYFGELLDLGKAIQELATSLKANMFQDGSTTRTWLRSPSLPRTVSTFLPASMASRSPNPSS